MSLRKLSLALLALLALLVSVGLAACRHGTYGFANPSAHLDEASLSPADLQEWLAPIPGNATRVPVSDELRAVGEKIEAASPEGSFFWPFAWRLVEHLPAAEQSALVARFGARPLSAVARDAFEESVKDLWCGTGSLASIEANTTDFELINERGVSLHLHAFLEPEARGALREDIGAAILELARELEARRRVAPVEVASLARAYFVFRRCLPPRGAEVAFSNWWNDVFVREPLTAQDVARFFEAHATRADLDRGDALARELERERVWLEQNVSATNGDVVAAWGQALSALTDHGTDEQQGEASVLEHANQLLTLLAAPPPLPKRPPANTRREPLPTVLTMFHRELAADATFLWPFVPRFLAYIPREERDSLAVGWYEARDKGTPSDELRARVELDIVQVFDRGELTLPEDEHLALLEDLGHALLAQPSTESIAGWRRRLAHLHSLVVGRRLFEQGLRVEPDDDGEGYWRMRARPLDRADLHRWREARSQGFLTGMTWYGFGAGNIEEARESAESKWVAKNIQVTNGAVVDAVQMLEEKAIQLGHVEKFIPGNAEEPLKAIAATAQAARALEEEPDPAFISRVVDVERLNGADPSGVRADAVLAGVTRMEARKRAVDALEARARAARNAGASASAAVLRHVADTLSPQAVAVSLDGQPLTEPCGGFLRASPVAAPDLPRLSLRVVDIEGQRVVRTEQLKLSRVTGRRDVEVEVEAAAPERPSEWSEAREQERLQRMAELRAAVSAGYERQRSLDEAAGEERRVNGTVSQKYRSSDNQEAASDNFDETFAASEELRGLEEEQRVLERWRAHLENPRMERRKVTEEITESADAMVIRTTTRWKMALDAELTWRGIPVKRSSSNEIPIEEGTAVSIAGEASDLETLRLLWSKTSSKVSESKAATSATTDVRRALGTQTACSLLSASARDLIFEATRASAARASGGRLDDAWRGAEENARAWLAAPAPRNEGLAAFLAALPER